MWVFCFLFLNMHFNTRVLYVTKVYNYFENWYTQRKLETLAVKIKDVKIAAIQKIFLNTKKIGKSSYPFLHERNHFQIFKIILCLEDNQILLKIFRILLCIRIKFAQLNKIILVPFHLWRDWKINDRCSDIKRIFYLCIWHCIFLLEKERNMCVRVCAYIGTV